MVTTTITKRSKRGKYKRNNKVMVKKQYKRTRDYYKSHLTFGKARSDIVPDRMSFALKYVQKCILPQPVAGTMVYYVFRGNSLFDPDFTGTGLQPEGFDEWSAFYTAHTVQSSKIRVRFTTVGNTNPLQNYEVCVVPSPQTVPTYTNIDAAKAAPYSKYDILALGAHIPNVKCYMTTSKIYGVPRQAISDDGGYSGSIASNPLYSWCWGIYANSVDPAAQGTVYAFVEITYYGEFYERNRLALS